MLRRVAVLILAFAPAVAAHSFTLPPSPEAFTESVPYDAMVRILESSASAPHVSISSEGKSVEGRDLWMVRLRRDETPNPWVILFYGLQHGNEPAGRDALVWMVDDLAKNPEKLPRGVDLYIIPNINPDAGEANQRRNANNVDLNRDHVTLSQPETRVLHRIAQRLMPHVAVDCHEFTRDTGDYREQGWSEWPLIMMDSANHPLFDSTVTAAGLRMVDAMAPMMEAAGYNYCRYFVGDAPPGENRYSHPELDDGRNGLGAYGGLSFIIEAGVFRNRNTPGYGEDLGQRVGSYHTLLSGFLSENDPHRAADRAAIEAARNRTLPSFIPTNYFWANNGLKIKSLPVVELATGKTLFVETGNFLEDLAVKSTVRRPTAYAIPWNHADRFTTWLSMHGIRYTTLTSTKTVKAETTELLRIETDFDPVYGRYGGRTITRTASATEMELPMGTLLVNLDQPNNTKAAILLEPGMLYGLAQFDEFAAIREGGLPIRLME